MARVFCDFFVTSAYHRCINAGKSLRNEDQAAVYKGLLRAVVSPDLLADKVANMMATVPGYPRQVPINAKQADKSPNNPFMGESSKAAENGHSNGDAKTPVVENGVVENSEEAVVDGDSKASSKPEATSSVELPLNPNDLMSPSAPLPPEVIAEPEPPMEPVNFLKSKRNTMVEESLPWVYFGLFDGHAGSGVAVAAANQLQKIVQDKLSNISDLLIEYGLRKYEQSDEEDKNAETESSDEFNYTVVNRQRTVNGSVVINHDAHIDKDRENVALLFTPATNKIVTVDNLIIGALEAAFWEMDKEIASDKKTYKMPGGCTALAAVFILGKLYVANAGDSR